MHWNKEMGSWWVKMMGWLLMMMGVRILIQWYRSSVPEPGIEGTQAGSCRQ